MSEKMQRDTDLDLDSLLAELAAQEPPEPSGAVLSRILADAAREQPRPAGIVPRTAPPAAAARPSPGWLGSMAKCSAGAARWRG